MKEQIENTKGVLQDLVVVVSLVRTLTDSFGSASDLYRKLKKKSKAIKKDIKEDIKEHIREDIQEEIDQHHREHPHHGRRSPDSDHERGRHRPVRWRSRSRSRLRGDSSSDSDEESIATAPTLVRAEFDRGYHYLGEQYAMGDLITRNQLQAQIIALQQTLLYIYEDIMLNVDFPRHSPSYHLTQLIQTTRATRTASIEALKVQYQRMLGAPDSRELLPLPGAFPASPTTGNGSHEVVVQRALQGTARSVGRSSDSSSALGRSASAIGRPETPKPNPKPALRRSWSSESVSSVATQPTPKPQPKPTRDSRLFCVYARDLQSSHSLPLADNFKPGGDNRCPFCHADVPVRPNKAWEIVKEDDKKKGVDRTFLVGTRFLVKCHREGGGYACALCAEYREADTVCTEVRALVEHLWKEHTCAELEWDGNIGEEK